MLERSSETKLQNRMCCFCKSISVSLSLRFSFVIPDRERTVTLTRPLSLHCFRTEWGSLSSSAVHCGGSEQEKITACLHKDLFSIISLGHQQQNPPRTAMSLAPSNSLHPQPQIALHLHLPLSLRPLYSLIPNLKSHMTAQKHPLPSQSTRACSPLPAAHVALGTSAHYIDRWSQPRPLSSPVGTPRDSMPE